MIIALINWRILPDGEEAFLAKWKTGLKLDKASGLIGEYLSKVNGPDFWHGVTWEMEPDDKDARQDWRNQHYISYVNVGLWERVEDFEAAVGKFMTSGRVLKEDFEAAPRRRAIVSAKHWRKGPCDLPAHTSEGVVD